MMNPYLTLFFSLAVATDCIQVVYNIDYDQCRSQFACQPKLRDIFSSARTLVSLEYTRTQYMSSFYEQTPASKKD